MSMFRLYYCHQHEITLPPGHKFPAEKYRVVAGLPAESRGFDLRPASPADLADLKLAHEPDYVHSVLDGSVDPRIMRRIGFPWSPGLVARTLASVGGTLHAFRGEGAGFCVFNDLAIAVLALRRDGLAARAAVIDLDVHQGDGTASIFEDDAEVLTVSIHGGNNFPFRKQRSSIDIALPDGTGDEEYLRRLREMLPRVAEFRPDVIFYQAGVDALAGDRLGRLALSAEGLAARDRTIFRLVKELSVPVVVTMGGGYATPIERPAEI